ncbi:MAG TPA: PilZ domain-containing protein, partial [Candidatus Omnitrophota bacterium]|nr:PilZ domain-containing protein [Candidatus Omnitrophota bacterium]
MKQSERRRYIRLEHIFPVEFRFLGTDGLPVSDWYQGFTQDVSEGGLCVTLNHIELADLKCLADRSITLDMRVNIPLGPEPVKAVGKLGWQKTSASDPVLQYALGVSYDKIGPEDLKRIMKYVYARKWFKAIAVT